MSHQALPGPRPGGFVPDGAPARRTVDRAVRATMGCAEHDRGGIGRLDSRHRSTSSEPDPRFIVEELLPYSRPERTAANLPLALDDPEAVWWVSSGSVDVFFTQFEPGATAGRRRHLCRVEEGGSIFAISGVRGRAGGGLLAVGAGPAQLLKFARGDLIRLSFEEGLSEQVAVLIDDWLIRVGRALADPPAHALAASSNRKHDRRLRRATLASACARASPGSATCSARRLFLTAFRCRRPSSIRAFRSPSISGSRAATACRVTACDTDDDDSHGRSLGGPRRLSPGDPRFHRRRSTSKRPAGAGPSSSGRSRDEAALFESVSIAAGRRGQRDVLARSSIPSDDALLTACRTVGDIHGHRGPRSAGVGP